MQMNSFQVLCQHLFRSLATRHFVDMKMLLGLNLTSLSVMQVLFSTSCHEYLGPCEHRVSWYHVHLARNDRKRMLLQRAVCECLKQKGTREKQVSKRFNISWTDLVWIGVSCMSWMDYGHVRVVIILIVLQLTALFVDLSTVRLASLRGGGVELSMFIPKSILDNWE